MDKQVESDDSFCWNSGLYHQGGVYEVVYHDDFKDEPVYMVRLLPEDYPDQYDVVGCGMNTKTFKTHFKPLRTAKLEKLNAVSAKNEK
jgi:hypothetical protein